MKSLGGGHSLTAAVGHGGGIGIVATIHFLLQPFRQDTCCSTRIFILAMHGSSSFRPHVVVVFGDFFHPFSGGGKSDTVKR